MKIKSYLNFISESIDKKKAVVITGDGFQDAELVEPIKALTALGYEVDVCGIAPGEVKAYNSEVKFKIDYLISEVNPEDYNILILPGGKAPIELSKSFPVITFVRKFDELQKPIAAICHGPLILAAAGLCQGKRMTCYEDAINEIEESGAEFVDSEVVVDQNFITSRNPSDIPAFIDAIIERLN